MKIYIICAVRGVDINQQITEYVKDLEKEGAEVHYPPRDVNQDDPTGERICREHRQAMLLADEVHVFWDVNSKGSHFDLGMAYALGKKIRGIYGQQNDTPGKSYWKAVICS